MRYGKDKLGFSLIELLIVIALTVTIGAVISLNFLGFFQRRNLDNDTQTIAFTLKAARDKAISQEDGNQWGVHFDNTLSPAGYYYLFEGGSFATGTVALEKPLGMGVQFQQPLAGFSSDVIFSKVTGLPTGISSVIIFLPGSPSNSSTITITPTGEVQY